MDTTARRTATRPGGADASRARRTRAAVLATVLATALAACQTGTEPGEPTGTPSTPSASATAEPTPSESSSPEPTSTSGPVVNGPNSITSPLPGETVSSPLTARGEGTAFEATLLYRVVGEGTEDVAAEGFTTAGANGEVGPWEIPLELDPGTWTLQVWEPDMSDGEGPSEPMRNLVEVTFTVG